MTAMLENPESFQALCKLYFDNQSVKIRYGFADWQDCTVDHLYLPGHPYIGPSMPQHLSFILSTSHLLDAVSASANAHVSR